MCSFPEKLLSGRNKGIDSTDCVHPYSGYTFAFNLETSAS